MADRRSNTTTEFRVHVIDVGQGDSILLEGPNGDTMLIDSGPWQDDGETVLNYLDEHDIDHLDHLVASHYDADHIGGHADVIEAFGSDNIGVVHVPKMGKYGNDSRTMNEFEDAVEEHEIPGNELQEGSDLHLGGVDIDVLNPSSDNASGDRNEDSVVMHCMYGEHDVLLTGDIGHETEGQLVGDYPDKLGQVDAVKIAHHGSKNSTRNSFLAACEAETAIFSHAEQNKDDHPDKETLYRAADDTDTAVSTALHGSTVLAFDGEDTISLQSETSTPNFAVMTRYCREHDEDFDTALVEDNALAYEDIPQYIPVGVVNDTSNVKPPKDVQEIQDENKELRDDKNDLLNDKRRLLDDKERLLDDKGELLDKNEELREQVDDLQTTLDDFIDAEESEAEQSETAANEELIDAMATPAEQVNTAITEAETVEEARQILEEHPDATDHLRDVVQTDRDEHVTTVSDVEQNKEAYRRAKQAEKAYQKLPLFTRFRSNIPNRFGGITEQSSVSSQNSSSSGDIDGPRDVKELPKAVRRPTAAEQRANGKIAATYLRTAEEAVDTAVDSTTTAETLRQTLRDTPGAHKDFLYAMDTPNAHRAHETDSEDPFQQETIHQHEQPTERSRDNDRGLSL